MAIWTDKVRVQRWERQVQMLARAKAYLDDQGIPPHAVNLKVLVPLLDYASLEEHSDEEMITRWAALLANAAAGEEGNALLPSFPRILAELSAGEARILDALYVDPDPARVPSLYHLYVPDSGLEVTERLFYTRCFNLDRLGLLEASWENVQTGADPPAFRHTVARLEGTGLGLSFVLACSPPSR